MSITQTQLVADASFAQAALLDLGAPFFPGTLDPICTVVQPDRIPYPQDHLLVHHDHMTVVLEKHHGAPVEVQVIDQRRQGDVYTRKICLRPRGQDKVVEWGIVRLNLRHMPPAVRDEILARQTPLGAILIRHDVHRRVKPRYFLRFPPASPMMEMFEGRPFTDTAYGRIGMIYCDDEPAIELLEIVVNTGTVASAARA